VWKSRLQITDDRWLDAPLLAPPPEEQAAIVKYLAHANARIDRAIAAKRRLIALLEEQSSGLRDQALRNADWPRRRLKTLLDRVDQGVSPQAENQEPGPGEWGVLKSGCVNGGSFRADQVKRLPDGFAIPEAMRVREGDLLVSRANGSPDLVGSAARVAGLKHQAILSDKTFRLTPSPTVDADFLAMSMNAQAYRQQVRTAISGADGLANNLPLSALRRFEFAIPPLQIQRALVRVVGEETSTLRLTMNRVTSEIALLQEFRTRLVADVVTGQVDVRAIAATLPDVPESESRHLDDPTHTLESDSREEELVDD
jgi:type I restriction enzyme S subunit